MYYYALLMAEIQRSGWFEKKPCTVIDGGIAYFTRFGWPKFRMSGALARCDLFAFCWRGGPKLRDCTWIGL